MHRLRPLTATALLTAGLAAQPPATYTIEGSSCSACTIVRMGVIGTPQVSGAFNLLCSNAPQNCQVTTTVLATGFQRISVPLPSTGCPLLVSPDVVLTPPSLNVRFSVPNDPGLLGALFFQQWIQLANQPSNPTPQFSTSEIGIGVIGV